MSFCFNAKQNTGLFPFFSVRLVIAALCKQQELLMLLCHNIIFYQWVITSDESSCPSRSLSGLSCQLKTKLLSKITLKCTRLERKERNPF